MNGSTDVESPWTSSLGRAQQLNFPPKHLSLCFVVMEHQDAAHDELVDWVSQELENLVAQEWHVRMETNFSNSETFSNMTTQVLSESPKKGSSFFFRPHFPRCPPSSGPKCRETDAQEIGRRSAKAPAEEEQATANLFCIRACY